MKRILITTMITLLVVIGALIAVFVFGGVVAP